MIRKLRMGGPAIAFALLIILVNASAALATNGTLTTSSGVSVHLHGTQSPGVVEKFIFTDHPISGSYATLSCTAAGFTSTDKESTANGASTMTVGFDFTGCTMGGLSATVNSAGCHYLFHVTTSSGVERFNGDVSFVGCTMKFVALTCEVQIHPQSNLSNVEFVNSGPAGATQMDILLKEKLSGITYTVTKDGIGCPFSGTGTFHTGDFEGETTMTGKDPTTGLAVGVTLH